MGRLVKNVLLAFLGFFLVQAIMEMVRQNVSYGHYNDDPQVIFPAPPQGPPDYKDQDDFLKSVCDDITNEDEKDL